MTVHALLLLALFLPAPQEAESPSDPAVIAAVLEEAAADSRVMEHLDVMVNDIGPRLTGSRALNEAGEWAVETFRSYGLEAQLEPWGEMPVIFERGVQRGTMVLSLIHI